MYLSGKFVYDQSTAIIYIDHSRHAKSRGPKIGKAPVPLRRLYGFPGIYSVTYWEEDLSF